MIRVEGLDEAVRALNQLSGGSWVNSALYEYGRAVQAASSPYVPQRPTTYRRTGTLGRGWYTRPGDKRVEVGNRAPYSGWVQQESTQAWMHRGYWHTVEQKGEDREEVFYKAVDRIVRRIFG